MLMTKRKSAPFQVKAYSLDDWRNVGVRYIAVVVGWVFPVPDMQGMSSSLFRSLALARLPFRTFLDVSRKNHSLKNALNCTISSDVSTCPVSIPSVTAMNLTPFSIKNSSKVVRDFA